jgi:hypothetical protein
MLMDAVDPDCVYVHSDDVVSREIEGELIIVPISSGIGDIEDELYTLNDTGRAIWNLMDGRRTLREIAVELTNVYNGSLENITRDVAGIVGELARRKIIVCSK